MSHRDDLPRRDFLFKLSAFALGCASAATGVFVAFKGRRIDPFLSTDTASMLSRLGSGRALLDGLDLSEAAQMKCATKVARLKRRFDTGASFWRRNDFAPAFRKAVERDYTKNDVLKVHGWILTETEVGFFLYNNFYKSGFLK
jgi:hypothetical protein